MRSAGCQQTHRSNRPDNNHLLVLMKILCAGKSEETFSFVKRVLEPLECEVIKATSLALALFLAQKNFPSLVLCENELTEATGLDLYDALQDEPALKDIPFMLFTSDNGKQLVNDRSNVQILHHPISEPLFLASLAPYLKERIDDRPEESSE